MAMQRYAGFDTSRRPNHRVDIHKSCTSALHIRLQNLSQYHHGNIPTCQEGYNPDDLTGRVDDDYNNDRRVKNSHQPIPNSPYCRTTHFV